MASTPLGFTLQDGDPYQQAIEDCSRALELDPKNTFAYASRGQTYADLKDYQQAMQDFDHALELDSNNTWAKDWREEAYRQLKKPKWMRMLGL
jgi:tetratricopeptide (TPR) repeat protein